MHTSTSFASDPKECGDVVDRRSPHVERPFQAGIEHQRDRPTNGLQLQDRVRRPASVAQAPAKTRVRPLGLIKARAAAGGKPKGRRLHLPRRRQLAGVWAAARQDS